LDRRTNTSDGAGGASPTVVTAPHDDDDDLMADTGKDTKIMTASATRSARAKVARAAAAAKEVLANGSSAMDEKTAVTQEVPALPADSIGTPRDSASLSRPVAAPVAPDADDDWALADHGLSSSVASSSVASPGVASPGVAAPAVEPVVPAEEEPAPIQSGTGWPEGSALFGSEAGLEGSDPAPAASPEPVVPTVSAASFVWDVPDPVPTSPSSPARNFLRSNTNAKTSAPPRTPPVSVGPARAGAAGSSPAPGARPKASSKRSSRQAHLTIARVEPWSVMKFSFVVSLVAFVILFVAVSVVYGTLSALGVFTSLQHVVQSVTSSTDSSGVNASKWFTASRILGYTALLGALNIVLITAMSTIGAVVYNLTSRLIGGVEVTLRETE
jgi:hypothetical protein